MASAIIPDESLRTFYTYNPTITSQTSQLSQSTNNQAGNDDSMWSRRGSGRAAAAGHGSTAAGAGGLGASTSNLTDLSVSSASLNSPMHSSHAASEASSYATRAITGVVDPADEDQFEEDDDDDDDDDDDVVVVRSSTATANRRRRHNAPISEEDEEAYDMQGEGEGEEREYNEPSTTSMFSSRLLDESEEDEITNGSTGAGYNAHLHGDADSLADATPEEVEARAMEVLGWDTIGQDKELYDVDLERWKRISSKHQEAGTPEYREFAAFLAEDDYSKSMDFSADNKSKIDSVDMFVYRSAACNTSQASNRSTRIRTYRMDVSRTITILNLSTRTIIYNRSQVSNYITLPRFQLRNRRRRRIKLV